MGTVVVRYTALWRQNSAIATTGSGCVADGSGSWHAGWQPVVNPLGNSVCLGLSSHGASIAGSSRPAICHCHLAHRTSKLFPLLRASLSVYSLPDSACNLCCLHLLHCHLPPAKTAAICIARYSKSIPNNLLPIAAYACRKQKRMLLFCPEKAN